MKLRLGHKMGKFLYEIERIPNSEFVMQLAFYELEPWGALIDETLNARLCATIYNTSFGVSASKTAQPRKALDYMTHWQVENHRFPSPKELKKKMEMQFKALEQRMG